MKVLFWLSLFVSVLLPITFFGFILFAFGGCVIFLITGVIASICFLLFLLISLSSVILLLIDTIKMFSLWRQHGVRLLLSPTLIILGFLVTIPIGKIASNLCQTRFQKHFSQYERAASEIESSITSEGDYKTPGRTMFLSNVSPIAYLEDDGTLTIEFIVGVTGPPPRHTAYLYRSNGIIEKGSRTAERWYRTTQVKEHWFRAHD